MLLCLLNDIHLDEFILILQNVENKHIYSYTFLKKIGILILYSSVDLF